MLEILGVLEQQGHCPRGRSGLRVPEEQGDCLTGQRATRKDKEETTGEGGWVIWGLLVHSEEFGWGTVEG